MSQWLIIDTNLLLLLVVGRADETLIASHKRLRSDYTPEDYRNIEALVEAPAPRCSGAMSSIGWG